MDPSAEIRFDGWTLLRPSGELLRDGTRIRLQTQPLQVLEELLARPASW
jgi:DNA-binding winged helix-turn-helix (wHTH) protein